MLPFEEKLNIIESFPELERRNVSLGRVNFHYEKSAADKKIVVYHLHPNGNGFVYAGFLNQYEKDDKDMVNIRDYTEDELRAIIRASIRSLTAGGGDEASDNTEKGSPAGASADVSSAAAAGSQPARSGGSRSDSAGSAPASSGSLPDSADAAAPHPDAGAAPEERWTGPDGEMLVLREEDELRNLYFGLNLEMAFETREEAVEYLREEGFRQA